MLGESGEGGGRTPGFLDRTELRPPAGLDGAESRIRWSVRRSGFDYANLQ